MSGLGTLARIGSAIVGGVEFARDVWRAFKGEPPAPKRPAPHLGSIRDEARKQREEN